MATKEISIVLRAKNAMAAGLSKAGESLKAFGASAVRVGKRLAVGFLAAGAAVAAFAAKAVQAYAVQEKAEKSLTAALDARGEAGGQLIVMLKKEAAAIQDQTGAADEQTLATMAQLSQLGVLTKDLANAAKATVALKSVGLEGASAQRAVAMAFAGNYSMLQRYIPALRDATTEQEKATIVSELFNRGYKQQAAELNTVSGQWRNLKGRVGDAMEAIGSAIAQNDGLRNALERAAEKVKAFGQAVTEWVQGEQFKAIQESVEGIINAMASGGEGRREAIGAVAGLFLAAIKDGGEWVGNHLLGLAPKIGTAIGNAFKDASKKVATSIKDADEVRKLMRDRGQITTKQVWFPNLTKWTDEQKAVYDQLMDGMAKVNKEAKKTEAGIDAQTDAVSRTAQAMAKLNAIAEKHKATVSETTSDADSAISVSVPVAPVVVEQKPTPEEIAADKLKIENQLKDDIQKLEDEKKKAQIDAQQAVLDDAKKKADEQQKLAEMRVQDFIDAAKQEKDIEADKAKEAGRAAELEARVGRGVKLSKRDQEFLDAFNKIKEAQENLPQAQNNVLLAQQELARLQGDANRQLAEIDRDLKRQRQDLRNLLIMQ